MKMLLEKLKLIEKYTVPEYLYHGTDKNFLDSIMNNGLTRPYLTNDINIAEYYTEDYDEPIILKVMIPDATKLIPDYNSIEEPLTYTLKKKEEQVWEEWQNSEKTWNDSLEIVGSVRYDGTIHPNFIQFED
jgi:hypothetical protein